MSGTESALALDAETRLGLATIRSLGKRGIRVVAGGVETHSIGFRSRFTSHTLVYPHPTRDPVGFARAVRDAVVAHGVGMVFPASDMTLAALSASEEMFRPHCQLPFPRRECVDRVLNKRRTLDAAHHLGIPYPRTMYPSSNAEALAMADAVGFPVVLKPIVSVAVDAVRGLEFKTVIAHDARQLAAALARIPDGRLMPLLQAYHRGTGVGVEVLLRDGHVLAMFQHRRLRDQPPEGGVSVLRVSEKVDAELADRALRLLRELQWDGVAMVEFRQYGSDPNAAVLMEVNGRIWGSIELAIYSGVDFPALAYDAFVHGQCSSPPAYRVGVRAHWMLGDLAALLMMRRARTGERPGLARSIASFMWSCSPFIHQDVLAPRDLGPALQEAANLMRRQLRRGGSQALAQSGERVRSVG